MESVTVRIASVCVVLALSWPSRASQSAKGAEPAVVAEWQWEQWPQQVVPGAMNTTRTPGPRLGTLLWFDQSASAWWLFGGRQVPTSASPSSARLSPGAGAATLKLYSDFWRYDTRLRTWSRIFPNDNRKNNNGGLMLLRSSLFNEDGGIGGYRKKPDPSASIVLCGRSEGKKLAERSLAIYGPKSSKSNTVWQYELKDRLWTAYVCCCDTTDRTTNLTAKNNENRPKSNRFSDLDPVDTGKVMTSPDLPSQKGTKVEDKTGQSPKTEAEDKVLAKTDKKDQTAVKDLDKTKKIKGVEKEKSSMRPNTNVDASTEKTNGRDDSKMEDTVPFDKANNEEDLEDEKPPKIMLKNSTVNSEKMKDKTKKKLNEKLSKVKPRNKPKILDISHVENDSDEASGHQSVTKGGGETTSTSTEAGGVATTPATPSAKQEAVVTVEGNGFPMDEVDYNQELINITTLEVAQNGTQEDMDRVLQEAFNKTERTLAAEVEERRQRGETESWTRSSEEGVAKSRQSRDTTLVSSSKIPQAFCPDFEATDNSGKPKGQPVAWCDTSRELLVALDIQINPLVIWQFDLKNSHWSQHKVSVEEGTLWPGCASNATVRYSSSGSTAYILCPPYGQSASTSTRLVYRITASSRTLQAAGQLQLNTLFSDTDGNDIWADETKTILQVIETQQQTLLLIACNRLLDIWVLSMKNKQRTSDILEPVENIWRGSALKWFRGYSSPFYNLQVDGVTYLMPNPRPVGQYWPRERGSFIIRLLESEPNDNINNNNHNSSLKALKQEFHVAEAKNTTIVLHHPGQAGLKALLFFAFSLSLFTIFGIVIFIRRCVTCPPRQWRMRSEECGGSKSTPPVIRYSVIPDDLAYPLA